MRWAWLVAVVSILGISQGSAWADGIDNGMVSVVPVSNVGFDVLSHGAVAASVRLSSDGLITAGKVTRSTDGRSLVFSDLTVRRGSGMRLGAGDSVTVSLASRDPYPVVAFGLTVQSFDAERWERVVGRNPFHFLAIYMADAEVWHQCGWLNETPVADPFPLLQDVHVGSPEISAYKYNRNWSYTVPLGGCPVPVIGLWAPKSRHYAGLEFQSTRFDDNSERGIATGYCWGDGSAETRKTNPGQFACLVYPHGGRGFQDLVFPKAGDRIASRGRILWSLDLPAAQDPNRLFYTYVWERYRKMLPAVPSVVDLSWLPGDARRADFAAPGNAGALIVSFNGNDAAFTTPGTKLTLGWTAYNESLAALAARNGDSATLARLESDAAKYLTYAKTAEIDGDRCVYWEKPLEGRWSDSWGGAPVTTIHNAESFNAGRLFLELYRYAGKTEYLPTVQGVLNWAKHVGWTRNELADIPSSPSGIGMLPCVSFCLDYYMTFKGSPDPARRKDAKDALDLARTMAYRYTSVWLSDGSRVDNLIPTYQWEVTSGRDWTAAACTADMMLDVLAMTAVHTGDPLMAQIVNGTLSRMQDLYQETYRDSIVDYRMGDFSESYGFYDGAVPGLGKRATCGGMFQIAMLQPVGTSIARLLAGEKSAMVFNKSGVHTSISDYRYSPDGNLSFVVKSGRADFDLAVTVPYVDISGKAVSIVRGGKARALVAGQDFIRPAQAFWSVMLKGVRDGDKVVIGDPGRGRVLPSTPPVAVENAPASPHAGFDYVRLSHDTTPDVNWDHLDSWAGVPSGELWSFGVPFHLTTSSDACALRGRSPIAKPAKGAEWALLLYSAGDGKAPSVVFSDGSERSVDTSLEAMAWRAWPPVYTSKLVVAPVDLRGKTPVEVRAGERSVWAMTILRSKGDAGELPGAVRAALTSAAVEWTALKTSEGRAAELRAMASKVPDNTIAVLPPSAGGPTSDYLQRAGLRRRSAALTPAQMVDPGYFNAKRFPVALYAADARYIHTVNTPGDGADALVRYVNEGGTLVVCCPGAAFPFYVAEGPGFSRGEPLAEKLGLPIDITMEDKHPEKLHFEKACDGKLMAGAPSEFPWPHGDVRLRTVAADRLPAGSRYTPIYRVVGESGKSYGDAAALIELPGGGRILFVFGILTAAPDAGPDVASAAVRYIVETSLGK